MIDLTRLMFDDGASRPPLEVETGCTFWWGAVKYRVTIVSLEVANDWYGFRARVRWLHYGEHEKGGPWHVDTFLKDPAKFFKERDGAEEDRSIGSEEVLYPDRFNPRICCAVLEEVS